jgi:hypothetical protein
MEIVGLPKVAGEKIQLYSHYSQIPYATAREFLETRQGII